VTESGRTSRRSPGRRQHPWAVRTGAGRTLSASDDPNGRIRPKKPSEGSLKPRSEQAKARCCVSGRCGVRAKDGARRRPLGRVSSADMRGSARERRGPRSAGRRDRRGPVCLGVNTTSASDLHQDGAPGSWPDQVPRRRRWGRENQRLVVRVPSPADAAGCSFADLPWAPFFCHGGCSSCVLGPAGLEYYSHDVSDRLRFSRSQLQRVRSAEDPCSGVDDTMCNSLHGALT